MRDGCSDGTLGESDASRCKVRPEIFVNRKKLFMNLALRYVITTA